MGFQQFLSYIDNLYNVTIYLDTFPDWRKTKILVKSNCGNINTSITINTPMIWDDLVLYEKIEAAAKMIDSARKVKKNALQ